MGYIYLLGGKKTNITGGGEGGEGGALCCRERNLLVNEKNKLFSVVRGEKEGPCKLDREREGKTFATSLVRLCDRVDISSSVNFTNKCEKSFNGIHIIIFKHLCSFQNFPNKKSFD